MGQVKMFRPDQVATRLGCTAQHVRRLWRQGKLAGNKLTERNLKIPETALEEYKNSINHDY